MSGPLVSFISDSINLGLGDIWAAGGPEYVRAFASQSVIAPTAYTKFVDAHVMDYAVRGEQRFLSQYPSRRKGT